MKTAKKRQRSNLRPKHKHTKEYLSHYYPFLPLMVSIGFLLFTLFSPLMVNKNVLAYTSNINPQSLLEATNLERKESGTGILQLNSDLQSAAQSKAEDMVNRNYWSHQTPEGNDPWIFIKGTNYTYQKAGENLAYGFNDSSDVITGWMNSPSHRQNLLDNNYQDVGFGVAQSSNFNQDGPATVVVAMYGQPQTVLSTIPLTGILGDSQRVANATLLTGNIWVTYVFIAIAGTSITYLVLLNSRRLKKAFMRGERFIISHPMFDSIIISILAISILLLRTAGSIH